MTTRETADLLARARSGDERAFREAVEPHLRELHVHCYRMLGSFHDAEDALQGTLLSAWGGLATFEERSSVRTWLYRIATNRCINLRRAPPIRQGVGHSRSSTEPYPDRRLDHVTGSAPGPEDRYERIESISLAFVTALQTLPPRQLAVLILRDVLGFTAREVADMMGSSVESVTSALKRARATLQRRSATDLERPQTPLAPDERQVVAEFVRAYESGDCEAIVALFTDDVFVSMPPIALEYKGIGLPSRFFALLFESGREYTLVTTRANGQPAFALYVRAADGVRHATGLMVITLFEKRISALTRFESGVLGSFGLPPTLPDP